MNTNNPNRNNQVFLNQIYLNQFRPTEAERIEQDRMRAAKECWRSAIADYSVGLAALAIMLLTIVIISGC